MPPEDHRIVCHLDDLLATRGRYLQIRYRGDDEIGGPA